MPVFKLSCLTLAALNKYIANQYTLPQNHIPKMQLQISYFIIHLIVVSLIYKLQLKRCLHTCKYSEMHAHYIIIQLYNWYNYSEYNWLVSVWSICIVQNFMIDIASDKKYSVHSLNVQFYGNKYRGKA